MLIEVQLVLYMRIYTKTINIYGVESTTREAVKLHGLNRQLYPSLNTQITININDVSLRDSTYSIRYDTYRILLLVQFQITSNQTEKGLHRPFAARYTKVRVRLSVSQKEPHYFDFNLKSWSWLALRLAHTTIISMHVKFSSWHR